MGSNWYDGEGGGVFIKGAAAHQSTITNSTISNNTTNYTSAPGGDAGGVFANNGLNVAGTIFSGNSAAGIYGSAGTFTGGGGLLVFPSTYALSVTTSTFTGNTLSSTNAAGAGMLIQSSDNTGDPTYTVSYSRFHGNLIAGSDTTSSGLALGPPEDSGSTTYAAVTATNNWWGCNTDPQTAGGNCDHAHVTTTSHNTLTTTPYTTLGLTLSPTSPLVGNTVAATASLGQNSTGTVYTAATDLAYLATPITGFFINDTSSQNYNPSSTSFIASVSAASNAASIDSGTINNSSTGMATVTVDGFTVTQSFQPTSPDLAVISAHTGNFKAGDTADTYTLTVSNIGTATTAGTVTVTDTPPSGFTATSLSGTGWTCTLSSLACTRSDGLSMSASYPVVTLTVSVSNSDVGTYTNLATVSGGDESNVSNDNNSDSTIVVGVPTISESFSPTTVAPNANSAVTFTLGNPSANSVSLTGVAFSDTLPSGLIVASPNGASTTCTGGTVTAAANGGSISLPGASLAAGTTCTATVNVRSPSMSSYVNTTGTVTATNSNAGGTATATLTVSVSPTRLVFLSVPPSPLTAGGNAGTIQVALEDGSGNVATNNSTGQVTLLVTGPSGYSQSYGPMTITNGVGSFNLSSVPLTTAGSYTYTASATSYTSASTSETINAGTVVALTVSGLTTFTAPGQAETATVRAIDSYGNANASFTGTVTLTSTDPLATFSPASYTYTAGDAGVHAFIVTAGEAGTETVTATSSSLAGSQPVIQVEDAVLAINPGGTLSRLTDAGVATSPPAGYSTSATSTVGLAINSAGNIWTLSPGNNSLIELGKPGSSVAGTFTGGGLNAPDSLAIDVLGQIWIANSNGTVSVFSATGAAVTGATSAYPVGTGATSGIAIDIAGNVWVTNSASGANTVTEILGGAAPVAPLATAVTSLTLGARP